MPTATSSPLPPPEASAWDKARGAFAQSPLVDTPLSSLAQDLDMPPWPVNSPDETPAAYIYLPYTQAIAALAARGLPPAQLHQLISLLNDTNAFDQPFGEMMDDIAAPASGQTIDLDSPLHKNMEKLALPGDFPLVLSALSPSTIQLCSIEKVDTLGAFVAFASRLSQAVIVGGDFRELLNALAQRDEVGLARLVPVRPGSNGLHLPEAVALAARQINAADRPGAIANPASIPVEIRARVTKAVAYFDRQHAALVAALAAGSTLEREVSRLQDPTMEALVAALLRPHLPAHQTTASAPSPAPQAAEAAPSPAPKPKKSFFQRLFGLG